MSQELQYAFHSGNEPHDAFAEVLHAGYEKCAPRHRAAIPRDHYLLHLVLAGEGFLKVEGVGYRVQSHQCFLIRPREEHFYQADANNPWEYLWLGFTGVTERALEEVYGIPTHAAAFAPASPTRLEFQMRRILTSLQSENPLEQLYAHALGVLALGCIGEQVALRSRGSSKPDYVEEAVSYIESNYASMKNAQSVVDYVGLDRSYFSKLFQDRTGVSVARFLAETRMSHAKRLLVDTDYKVSAVAGMVGYDKYQSFERRFTSLVGMPPTEFRRRPAGERVKAGWYGLEKGGNRRSMASGSKSEVGEDLGSNGHLQAEATSVGIAGASPAATTRERSADPGGVSAGGGGWSLLGCRRTARVADAIDPVEVGSGATALSKGNSNRERATSEEEAGAFFAGSRGCPSRIRKPKDGTRGA